MIEKLALMIESHYPIIAIQSFEWERISRNVKEYFQKLNYKVTEWNRVRGLYTDQIVIPDTEDPSDAIHHIYHSSTSKSESQIKEIFFLLDFHEYLKNNDIIRTSLRLLSYELKYTEKTVLLLSPIVDIPCELEKEITVLEVPLPDKNEIQKTLNNLIKEIEQGNKIPIKINLDLEEQLVNAAVGLTLHEADLAFSKAYVQSKGFTKDSVKLIVNEKEQIIKKSKILEYYHTSESFHDVGGLDNLKNWLQMRAHAFSQKASDFGLESPKGILLTGIPGCGKSLVAKAIANVWQMPLLRLDVGKVFGSLVGSSESNIRTAILTAESIAPCVLWIDEIEKGLSGVQSSDQSDAGTAARVFSTFLTWMQEKTKPVFIVATANKLDNLPPELLRKGRFDEIFFVDLPTEEERAEIFKIHIEKIKRSFTDKEYRILSQKTEGFTGSEIENVIKESLHIAFNRVISNPSASDLTVNDILNIIQSTIPLSVFRKEQIENMRQIAIARFKLASSDKFDQVRFDNNNVPLTSSEQKEFRSRHFKLD